MNNYFSNDRDFENEKRNGSANKEYLRILKDKTITPVFLKANVAVNGYILPDFDRSLSVHDTAYRTSVGSYRKPEKDKKTGHPRFSEWVLRGIPAYLFYQGRYNFISPEYVGQRDPIVDLRKYIYGNKISKYMWLVGGKDESNSAPKDQPSKFNNIMLPSYSYIAIMNVVCNPTYTGRNKDDVDVKPRIMVLKSTAYNNLESALNSDRPGSIDPVDPEWADYKYGDVTRPEAAVNFTTCSYPMDKNGYYTGLKFGNESRSMGRITDLGITTTCIPENLLAERLDLMDIETYHIAEYQDILDVIINTGRVDKRLLIDACGDMGDIHEPENHTKPVQGFSAETSESDNSVESVTEDQSQPAPPMPPTPPAPHAVKERDFWVAVNGKTSRKVESEIQDIVDNTDGDVFIMLVGEREWRKPEFYGIIKDEIPMPPAPPTPPAPPVKDNHYAKPAPLSTPIDPAAERRTKEEEEEMQRIRGIVESGNSATLPVSDLKKLGALQRKLPYIG